jgi:flagellar hook-associated protein 2
MNASVEQVGSDAYRLVIKSEDTGLSNKLTMTGAASTALGLNLGDNNILKAQNLEATVDGVGYNVSSNILNIDGLKITANKSGESSINISEDNTQIETQMKNFVTKYNELVASIESEAQSSDSSLSDKSTMRSIINQIKDKLFGSYGSSGDKSVFNYGIELDKYGSLSLNSAKFNSAVQNDKSGLKDLFAGSAEKKGLGTILKETLDQMTFTGGVLDTYEKAMLKRETTLNTDKTTAEKALDKKYELLSSQFASYGTIINQMESSFSGLKLMINQSASGN